MIKYEKPDLEELELILEGSFLGENSVGIDKENGTGGDYGEDMDLWD